MSSRFSLCLLTALTLAACGPLEDVEPVTDESVETAEQALLPCTHRTGYCDAPLREAILAVLADGRLYQHEVYALRVAAMDGIGVSATEDRDLRRLLSYERDRIEPVAALRIGEGLSSWNWRRAIPKGLLAAKVRVDDLHTLWLRGSSPGNVRLTLESPSQLGPREEVSLSLQDDGRIGGRLIGYLSNDGRVVLPATVSQGPRELGWQHETGSPAALPAYRELDLRKEIELALTDGNLYQHELAAVLELALDGDAVDAGELADLERLLLFERDRIGHERTRIQEFLASCNWRTAIPAGPLNLAATVSFSGESSYNGLFYTFTETFQVRGSLETGVRLSHKSPGVSETSLYLQRDGRFSGGGMTGYLSNDGRVVLMRHTVIKYGPGGAAAALAPAPE